MTARTAQQTCVYDWYREMSDITSYSAVGYYGGPGEEKIERSDQRIRGEAARKICVHEEPQYVLVRFIEGDRVVEYVATTFSGTLKKDVFRWLLQGLR